MIFIKSKKGYFYKVYKKTRVSEKYYIKHNKYTQM